MPGKPTGLAPQSAEVVRADDLRRVIEHVVDTHNAQYGIESFKSKNGRHGTRYATAINQFRPSGVLPVTGQQWVEQESGFPWRTIYQWCYKSQWVDAYRADKLLTAIGKSHEMSPNGSVPIVPNPYWDREKWQQRMAERGCS